MSRRALVAFGTKQGFTAEMAETLGESLQQSSLDVDVRPTAEVTQLDGDVAVIAGSSVNHDQWHKDGLEFLERFELDLVRKPTSIFSGGPNPDEREHADASVVRAAARPTTLPPKG